MTKEQAAEYNYPIGPNTIASDADTLNWLRSIFIKGWEACERENHHMRWVKVSERLPSEDGSYFVYCKGGRGSLPFKDGAWPDSNSHPHMGVFQEVIEWLDEAAPSQQLFSREEVENIILEWQMFLSYHPDALIKDWFKYHYPSPKQ